MSLDARPPVNNAARSPGRLARREWALVALGLVTWILLAWGSVWLVRQLTRRPENCTSATEVPTRQVKDTSNGPRNAVQLLTGTGRCP